MMLFDEADKMLAGLAGARGGMPSMPDFGTFSVSTRIPLPLLVEEEKALDYEALEGKACLKKKINDYLAKRLAKATGKKYKINGDVRFTFNFIRHKASWEFAPLYIFGRYNKLSRGIAQSKWHCQKCMGAGCARCSNKGKMYDSVEEILAGYFTGAGKGTKFHSSGREDIDARMMGRGRPFALEIGKPTAILLNLQEIEHKINQRGDVKVNGLRKVGREFVELVDQSHFTKEYEVFVDCEGEVPVAMVKKLNLICNLDVAQQTPERVLHRRADLVRERVLRKLGCAKPGPKLLKLHLVCDAGFYVKEFVHGDNGRTKPSLSSILGMKCTPRDLDVVNIQDAYLDFMMGTIGNPF